MLNGSRKHRTWLALLTAFALLAALGSCRGATEIRLHVRTNAPCTDPSKWQGIAVYVGQPGADVENKAPALTATDCDANGHPLPGYFWCTMHHY